jgi:tRNA(Met) cytidine acetyltransferase
MRLPQRQCLILLGEDSWLTEQARAVYQQAADAPRCWLSDAKDRPADAISSKQAGQQLGRSNHLIIFDGRSRFSADAFGALIGSLRAGGLMLVLLSAGRQPSLWLQRFLRRAAGHAGIEVIRQAEGLAPITLPAVSAGKSPVVPTADQEQAINAVMRVVSGHRRRPLVIASDRGRGKTALLGMAAAELLKQDKQTILVTAPSINNITPLFQHADAQLPGALWDEKSLSWQQGRIVFIAPDALLEERPAADCLIIDEAAAIPSQMLTRMLKAYSRIVFATTLHGYEGTGRGFALRFRKTLDTLTPNWRFCELYQPVRWADDDRLELFSFDALLLDAEPAVDRLVEHARLEQA